MCSAFLQILSNLMTHLKYHVLQIHNLLPQLQQMFSKEEQSQGVEHFY